MADLKTLTKLAREITEAIDGAVDAFNDAVPASQRRLYDELLELLKDLEVRRGRILNNAKNLRIIQKMRSRIEKIVVNDKYVEQVRSFTKTFNEVAKMQRGYFRAIISGYSPPETVNLVRNLALESTIENLLESGIEANLSNPIKDLLTRNVTSGGSFAQLQQQLQEYILGNDEVDGRLLRYSKQITTDSLNQFSREYHKQMTDDLKLRWYMYVGGNIKTTREFCHAMTAKRYFHRSEIPQIVQGRIDGVQVPVYERTGLPHGMIPGTNQFNFEVNAGGYNCGHGVYAIPTVVVPVAIREALKNRLA